MRFDHVLLDVTSPKFAIPATAHVHVYTRYMFIAEIDRIFFQPECVCLERLPTQESIVKKTTAEDGL